MVLFNAGRAPILCPQGRDRHRPKAGTVTMCSITAPAWGPHGAPGRGSAWSSPPGARGAPPGSGRDPGSQRQHSWEHRCGCCSSAPPGEAQLPSLQPLLSAAALRSSTESLLRCDGNWGWGGGGAVLPPRSLSKRCCFVLFRCFFGRVGAASNAGGKMCFVCLGMANLSYSTEQRNRPERSAAQSPQRAALSLCAHSAALCPPLRPQPSLRAPAAFIPYSSSSCSPGAALTPLLQEPLAHGAALGGDGSSALSPKPNVCFGALLELFCPPSPPPPPPPGGDFATV